MERKMAKLNLITFLILISNISYANTENIAVEAFIKQTKIDIMLQDYADKKVPKSVKGYIQWLIPIQQVVVEKQIKYSIDF